MSEKNLISALNQNRAFLGKNYEKIGKRIGFFGRKVFLSHDKTGWSIVRLNLFQLFFRNIFGLYKNTHLSHVYKCLSKEESHAEVAALPFYLRITKIWTEKYLKWVGNASLKDAKVICFAETHYDRAYRAAVQQFINENYIEGDIVLTEGVKAGKIVKPRYIQQTRGLKENCLIMGWEPQNFKELNQKAFGPAEAKYQELTSLVELFKTTFPKNCQFNQTEISHLRNSFEEIGNKIVELNQYYQSKKPLIVNIKRTLSNLLQQVKDHKFEEPRKSLLYIISKILTELEKMQEKALYKNLSPEAAEILKKNAPLRDSSLIHEIQKYRSEGRRIFVIGGLAHFLQTPITSENLVKKELAKHQFVVLGRSNEIDKFANLNKDMPSQSA